MTSLVSGSDECLILVIAVAKAPVTGPQKIIFSNITCNTTFVNVCVELHSVSGIKFHFHPALVGKLPPTTFSYTTRLSLTCTN
jgi:hypothetical protein